MESSSKGSLEDVRIATAPCHTRIKKTEKQRIDLIQKKEEELRLTTGSMTVSKSGGQLRQAPQTTIEEMRSFA